MGRFASVAFLGCVLLCGAGCSAITGGPDRIHPVQAEAAVLATAPILVDPENVPPPNSMALYNYVTQRMYEIDLEYNVYFARLTTDYQMGSLAGDLAILGLTASSTLAPAVVTKTVLSATATAVTGAKTAIDKDVLLTQTIQIIQNQMEASRTHIKNSIMGNLNSMVQRPAPLNPYTYWQALSDLEDYYRAGTLPGALEALQATTGTNAQNSKSCATGVNADSTQANCAKPPPGGNGNAHATSAGVPHLVRGGGSFNARGAPVPALVR